MPIYAYKCSACGFAKDVLQKISDAPLVDCPACQQACFSKQLTAPGFQLKGTGWYATDFSGKKASTPSGAPSSSDSAESAPAAAAPAPSSALSDSSAA